MQPVKKDLLSHLIVKINTMQRMREEMGIDKEFNYEEFN